MAQMIPQIPPGDRFTCNIRHPSPVEFPANANPQAKASLGGPDKKGAVE